MRTLALFLLGILMSAATQAAPEGRVLYSAQDTLRMAQVGTPAPRPAAPPRTTRPAAQTFERMTCTQDPSRPLGGTIICTPRRF